MKSLNGYTDINRNFQGSMLIILDNFIGYTHIWRHIKNSRVDTTNLLYSTDIGAKKDIQGIRTYLAEKAAFLSILQQK